PANAPGGRGDEQFAEWAVERGPADRLSAPTVAPCRWGHPQPLLRIAVEAARALVAGIVHRVGHAPAAFERLLCPAAAQGARIFRRRDSEVALEQALEMVRRIADGRR